MIFKFVFQKRLKDRETWRLEKGRRGEREIASPVRASSRVTIADCRLTIADWRKGEREIASPVLASSLVTIEDCGLTIADWRKEERETWSV